MSQQQEKEYTWDDLVNAIGQDFSGGETVTGADAVERGLIRRYTEPIEMDCPLHYDDEVAKQHGYQGIIAPWSSVFATFVRPTVWKPGDPTRWPVAERNATAAPSPPQASTAPLLPKPKTTAGFATDVEIEYFAQVYVGDRLTVKGRKLVSVTMRRTSVGFGAFMVFESEIFNQRGERVAVQRNGNYAYNPGAES